jgi:HK97 gp10 family phage protein
VVTRIHHREINRLAKRGGNRQVRDRTGRDSKAMARLAAQLAPKDTGALAASIHAEEQADGTWRVSWDTAHAYGKYQELGTERNSAQPFLRPAAKRFER